MVDSVKGKAKEVFGAVTGNDSLTAEGQLEHTQAQERKEANSVEAVADAEADQARTEAADAKTEGARERMAVGAEAAVVEKAATVERDEHKRAAEQAGEQQAARDKTRAELDAQLQVQQAKAAERADVDAAAQDLTEAVDEHRSAVQVTSGAQTEADRIRERADRLTAEADLP